MKRGPEFYLENSDEWDGYGFPEEYEDEEGNLPPGTEEVELTTAGIVALKGRCKAKEFKEAKQI